MWCVYVICMVCVWYLCMCECICVQWLGVGCYVVGGHVFVECVLCVLNMYVLVCMYVCDMCDMSVCICLVCMCVVYVCDMYGMFVYMWCVCVCVCVLSCPWRAEEAMRFTWKY